MAHDAIIESHLMQVHHTNSRLTMGVEYAPGDLVYLSTQNLALPKGRANKILPNYFGLYKVVEVHIATLTVMLELLPS